MRMTLKLVVSLVIGIAAVAFLFAYLQVRGVARAMRQQMEKEVARTADNMSEALRPALDSGSRGDVERLAERYEARDHLAGVAVYDAQGRSLARTSKTDEELARSALAQADARHTRDGGGIFIIIGGDLLAYVLSVERD